MEKTAYIGKVLFVCSNAVVYNKYLYKNSIACEHSFVNSNAHHMSIEGSIKLSNDILNKLDIEDIYKAFVNTVEYMNIPIPSSVAATSTFSTTLTTWKTEFKALEDKIK